MNAVIYCRVSSREQVEGTSLESQERACKEYAARNKLNVVRVFIDRGESAKFADRPQLLELIAYCGKKQHDVKQVLVWKVDRLARNVGDHFNIKANLLKHEVRVVSVTEPIDANPEGKLLETILAGFAQFDNDIRAARTLQGMRHKIQGGLFPWKAPLGYRSVTRGAKKTEPDQPEQPAFGLLQHAWKELATGNCTKAQIRDLLTSQGLRTKAGKKISSQSIDWIFSDPFYAGILRDPWSGEEHLGRHLPMIDRETFGKMQQIFRRRGRSVPHKALRLDFPLRTFVKCAQCKLGLTGSFSRGRSKTYPYYRCFSYSCDNHASYPQKYVHEEFLNFLDAANPTAPVLTHIEELIREFAVADMSLNQALQEKAALATKRIKEQQQQLIRMKMDQLISDEEFIVQRTMLSEQLADLVPPETSEELSPEKIVATLNAVSEPLRDLAGIWRAASADVRRRFQQWVLPEGYILGAIGTARRGRLFSLFSTSAGSNTGLVHPAGVSWNQLQAEILEFSAIAREVERNSSPLKHVEGPPVLSSDLFPC